MVFQRKLDLREAFLDVGHDGGKITAARIGADVNSPFEILSGDDVRTGLEAYLRDIGELDLPSVRRVDQELAHAGCVLAGIWRAPHIDVISSAVLKDVGNLGPSDECRCGAAHVAGFDAVTLGRRQVGSISI